ncbi:MAG: hypothetical protein RJQ09_15460 [Cyclobacteriaceae bacterium]
MKVSMIGGVFFKSDDPKKMQDWYAKHLGVPYMSSYGGTFVWNQRDNPDEIGHTAWSAMGSDTNYYDPSEASFMINYRVSDLEILLKELESNGVKTVGKMESFDYGKFGWALDAENNKIEFWEPVDSVYAGMLETVNEVKRVTGIGGVFFKAKDPKGLQTWYGKQLGIPNLSQYGGIFEWRSKPQTDAYAHTVWGVFDSKTDYFNPGKNDMIINYRVENLEDLMATLKSEGVEQVGKIDRYDYGNFGWILDPDGNKIELWEPNDEVFRKVNGLG